MIPASKSTANTSVSSGTYKRNTPEFKYDSTNQTVTYYEGDSGWTSSTTGRNSKTYNFKVTSAAKFQITGDFPDSIENATLSDYFLASSTNNTVTVTENFVNELRYTSETASLTLDSESVTFRCAVTSPKINGSANDDSGNYTCTLSAYGTPNGNNITFYKSKQFSINGLASGLTITDGKIYSGRVVDESGTVTNAGTEVGTISISNEIVNISLKESALVVNTTGSSTTGQNVSVTGLDDDGYTVQFNIDNVNTTASQDPSTATGTSSGFNFTAGGNTAGYMLSNDGSEVVFSNASSGKERFTVSGLSKDLSSYAFNISGNTVTATKDDETINVGTVTKGTTSDGKTTFTVALTTDVLPSELTNSTIIGISSNNDVSFTLTGDAFNALCTKQKAVAVSVTKSESTPPPNQLRRRIYHGGLGY